MIPLSLIKGGIDAVRRILQLAKSFSLRVDNLANHLYHFELKWRAEAEA